jgi:radical SAM superfamily enzyme YgiQ (UPF0313 family)
MGSIDPGRRIMRHCMQPLGLGVLASSTPAGFEPRLLDDCLDPVDPTADDCDAAFFGVETFAAARAYELAAVYRARGVPVILGGYHPTLAPEEASSRADCIVLGDGEAVWPELLADLAAGRLKSRYSGEVASPQAGAIVDHRVFRKRRYLPAALVQLGRGCPHRCSFCASSPYFGGRRSVRPIEEVIEEIRRNRLRNILFTDDNIAADEESLGRLCSALEGSGVRWAAQACVEIARNRALLAAMARGGCVGLLLGLEALEEKALKEMGKRHNLAFAGDYAEPLRVLDDCGLQAWGAFTIGYDADTEESILARLDFAIGAGLTMAAFNLLMPYPSTGFYRALADEGRLLYGGAWWLDPGYRYHAPAYRPLRMSPDRLSELAWHCNRRFYGAASAARRFAANRVNRLPLGNLLRYLLYNAAYQASMRGGGA